MPRNAHLIKRLLITLIGYKYTVLQTRIKTLRSSRHRNRMRITLFNLPIIPENGHKIALDKFSEPRNRDDIKSSIGFEVVFGVRQKNL